MVIVDPTPYRAPRLRDMAVSERPQERLERLGPSAVSDVELVAMLLRSGNREQDVLTLSARLVAEAGSLATLLRWNEADFRRVKGIGRVKALQLVAVVELARRVVAQMGACDEPLFREPEAVFEDLAPLVAGLAVEKVWVYCLNPRCRLLKRVEASSGTATASLVHPREVFREAVRVGATAVLVAHNHPSGDPAPSPSDFQVTSGLRKAAEVLQISLLDHVIIGRPEADPAGRGFYSFQKAGMLGNLCS